MASDNVEYQLQTFKRLRELQSDGTLCDLVLMSMDHVQFKVHASVIVSASQSFYNLLMEKGSLKKIRLMNVTGEALELLIRFIYGQNLKSFEELKLLSQTLMKLGMKDLFQYIGTSLCDFDLERTKPENLTTGPHCAQSKNQATYYSHEMEIQRHENTHSEGSVKQRGDNQDVDPVNVKVEPVSSVTVKDKLEKNKHVDDAPIQIKSEPIEITSSENFNGATCPETVSEENQHNDRFASNTSQSDGTSGIRLPTAIDMNAALKPVGLYMNETLTKNKTFNSGDKPRNCLSDIKCMTQKYVVVMPPSIDGFSNPDCDPTHHSYKAVINGVQNNDGQDSKSLRESVLPKDNADSSPNPQKQINTKHKGQQMVSNEIPVPKLSIESKRVQVVLRPIDDSGNYAIFPVSNSMTADSQPVDNNQSKWSHSQDSVCNAQKSEEIKLDGHVPHQIKDSSQVTAFKKQSHLHSADQLAVNAGSNPQVQSSLKGQPQKKISPQLLITATGQVVPFLPQTTEMNINSKPASPSWASDSWIKVNTHVTKPIPTARKTNTSSSKVREIVPKGGLKIDKVVSLQGKEENSCKSGAVSSEPSQDSASKRMKEIFANAGLNFPVEERFESKSKPNDKDKPKIIGNDVDENTSDCSAMPVKVIYTGKRKSGNEEDHSSQKKRKEMDLDEEDSQEYLVIDLEEETGCGPAKDDLLPNDPAVCDLPFIDTDSNESGPSDMTDHERFELNEVLSVSNCTLEEVPHIAVGRKTRPKTQHFTLRRELDFFHDQEDMPTNVPMQGSVTAKSSKKQIIMKKGASNVSKGVSKAQPFPVSCVKIEPKKSKTNSQNTKIKVSKLGNVRTVCSSNNLPVVVHLSNGKVAILVTPETASNSSSMPAASQVQILPNSNKMSKTPPVQNSNSSSCSNFVQKPNLGPQIIPVLSGVAPPVSTVMSRTQQLVQQTESSGTPVSSVKHGTQKVGGVQNILQPPVISGNQLVHPQFLVQNIANQNLGQTITIPGQTNIQFPGQPLIIRQTQPGPFPNVSVNCLGNRQTPLSGGIPVTLAQPRLQVIGPRSPWGSAVPVGSQVTSQLVSPSVTYPSTANPITKTTAVPPSDKAPASGKPLVAKMITGNMIELRPKESGNTVIIRKS